MLMDGILDEVIAIHVAEIAFGLTDFSFAAFFFDGEALLSFG